MKFGAGIRLLRRLNCNIFVEILAFLLAPFSGTEFENTAIKVRCTMAKYA